MKRTNAKDIVVYPSTLTTSVKIFCVSNIRFVLKRSKQLSFNIIKTVSRIIFNELFEFKNKNAFEILFL